MKILVADDDTTSRLLLRATLMKFGHQVTAVEDGLQALEYWRQEQPPLIISDWMMPGLDGLQLCRLIRDEPALHYTYVMLLTSLAGKSRYLDGMSAGADDFLNKPYDEDLLAARLQVAERILALHQTLRIEASHDRLTGLWNRAAILDRLEQQLAFAPDPGRCIGVVLADVDHFKAVNDTHGHATGDRVLQEFARRMQACVGENEHVGRYGGEEFLGIAVGNTPSRAADLAECMRVAVTRSPISGPDGPLAITASFGVASICASGPSDAEALIAVADTALYRAKQLGRNRVEVAPFPTAQQTSDGSG